MLTCLVPVLFTFYIQGVLNLKKNNSGAKGLISIRGIWYISVKILRTKHAKKNIYEIVHKYWQYHVCVCQDVCHKLILGKEIECFVHSFGRRNILGMYMVFKATNCFFF